jgi:hypothetical protein
LLKEDVMGAHRYRITVEPLTAAANVPALSFEIASHDEILELVGRTRQRGDFDADTAAAFTVGLKLLGEVLLRNRRHPLFEAFHPHFGQFMKRLKGGAGSSGHRADSPAE